MCSGSEFQIVGAAKENERLPLADFMLGTTSRFFPSERNDLTGTCRCSNSDKYIGQSIKNLLTYLLNRTKNRGDNYSISSINFSSSLIFSCN